MKKILFAVTILFLGNFLFPETNAQTTPRKSAIDELTPSKSIYFDWINRNWFGSNEKKIEANLRFFKWLHDEYGMKLDIYLMDAGDIDQGPHCALEPDIPVYGSLETEWFKKRFPNGFGPLVELAESFNCRLGIWLGPDGYGDTPEEARVRREMLVKFCEEYNFAVFKFDACASDLSPENQQHFIETMQECLEHTPDLIILNHRINLNEEASKFATTFLWEGQETYVDVNITNNAVAPHHRQGNLSRGVPPNLMRLTEDHGVCISSVVDYWDDDLILQAFNRNLILAPEIYGSPFLLNDIMLPRLARIYNIHRSYNEILVNGIVLPEDRYGLNAVSRGDGSTRLITLRNLSWDPLQVSVKLDESIGLSAKGEVDVFQYHPTERYLGKHQAGSEVEITVMPFRASLIRISSGPEQDLMLRGVDYHVMKDTGDGQVLIDLLGETGKRIRFDLPENTRHFKTATINGKSVPSLLKGRQISHRFPGKNRNLDYLKKLGDLQLADIPDNSGMYFEYNIFAADNNALEVRELQKSGATDFPSVQAARDAFFNDTIFIGMGLWDKYAFDGDLSTSFKVRRYFYRFMEQNNGAFRLDLGEVKSADSLVFKGVPADFDPKRVEVSPDLASWHTVGYTTGNSALSVDLADNGPVRYLRMAVSPVEVAEIEGYKDNSSMMRDNWRASNMFESTGTANAELCWLFEGELSGIGNKANLAVTVPGTVAEGSVFAVMIADGKIIGANDRAPSFPYNNWEHFGLPNRMFTYYIPVGKEMEGKTVRVMLLSADGNLKDIEPEVWLTNHELHERARLVLE
jgi:hypothetical protein